MVLTRCVVFAFWLTAACSTAATNAPPPPVTTSTTTTSTTQVPPVAIQPVVPQPPGSDGEVIATVEPQRRAPAVVADHVHQGEGMEGQEETLACIRRYESGGNYTARNGAGHSGAYQFDRRTWASVGGTGEAAEASPEEQDARARTLMAQRGLQPWSVREKCR